MKKTFLLAAGLMAASSVVMAQSSIDTYDVCDADLNHVVSVADATAVVNRVLANTPGNEVVTAADLNALLTELNNNIVGLRKDVADVKQRVNYVMTKSGFEYPFDPDANGVIANGHEYVDLGLKDSQGRTIYWATCNVGAESPEDYGLYFAWGDTEGHSSNKTNGEQQDGYSYDWANAPFNNGSSYYDASYFATVKDEVCPDGVLAPEYDAAHVQWGGDWRMPTSDELDALINDCTWTWNATNKGYTVKGKNGKSIFLPASGDRYGSYLGGAGSFGNYWSSSLDSSGSDYAYHLVFLSSDHGRVDDLRYYGFTVRPVLCSVE